MKNKTKTLEKYVFITKSESGQFYESTVTFDSKKSAKTRAKLFASKFKHIVVGTRLIDTVTVEL